jgi:GH35 family endo-1,4-beta-xylanase
MKTKQTFTIQQHIKVFVMIFGMISIINIISCKSIQEKKEIAFSHFSGKDTEGIEKLLDDINNSQEKWRIEANKRIDKYRKSDLTIQVIDSTTKQPIPNATITALQTKHLFRFGGIFSTSQYMNNKEKYLQLFKDMGFNASGFPNGLKYKLWIYFKNNDQAKLIKWFRENGLYVRGHCLIWPGNKKGNHLPYDLFDLVQKYQKKPSDILKKEINNYTMNMIETWAKKWDVDEWDVINEPRANHLIQDILGDKIAIETQWFKIAKKNMQHPSGLLYLNENKIISDSSKNEEEKIISKKIKKYYDNVKALLANGAPISGLGFQTRFGKMIPAELIYKRLCVFDEFNLQIAATEFEIKKSIKSELDKTLMTERVMTIYFSHSLVNGIYSWTILNNPPKADSKQPQDNNTGLINPDYTPNLRGKMWLYLTKNKWHTNEQLNTQKDGTISLRGFKGTYKVKIKTANKEKELNLILDKDMKLTIEI